MSSHHFVKEDQEPALVILDALTFDKVGPLLEWAPLVIVARRAIEDVIRWNIKVDVVLAEEKDVKELSNRLADQVPLTILAHPTDESPLVNALHYLIRKKQNDVNVFCLNLDEAIMLTEKFAPQLQICIMDDTAKWSVVAAGHFEKWMAAKTSLFLRKSQGQQSIDLIGLKLAGDHYETTKDGLIRVQSDALFWVGEPYFSD
jgi:hypothetical protein